MRPIKWGLFLTLVALLGVFVLLNVPYGLYAGGWDPIDLFGWMLRIMRDLVFDYPPRWLRSWTGQSPYLIQAIRVLSFLVFFSLPVTAIIEIGVWIGRQSKPKIPATVTSETEKTRKTIAQSSFCPECGARFLVGDEFCRKCGIKVSEYVEEQ